eukprot:3191375-Pleurochrysis_carterae.AAC.3
MELRSLALGMSAAQEQAHLRRIYLHLARLSKLQDMHAAVNNDESSLETRRHAPWRSYFIAFHTDQSDSATQHLGDTSQNP